MARADFEIVTTSDGEMLLSIFAPGTTAPAFDLLPAAPPDGWAEPGGGGDEYGSGSNNLLNVGQTGYKYPNEYEAAGGPRIAGYYQAPNKKYYKIQVSTSSYSGEDDWTPPPCPCGPMTRIDGERGCYSPCSPPTCGRVYPQQTQTSRTSGDFYIMVDAADDHATRAAYPGPRVFVDVWSEANGQDDLRRYDGIRYGEAADNNYYVKINLADHPGLGVINVAGTVQVWMYGEFVSCPATNFSRLSYITGNVYYDPGATCSTAQPWTLTNNLGVGYNNGGAVTAGLVQSSGEYVGMYVVSSNTGANVSLQLINMPAAYTCSPCNTLTCPNTASVAPGSTNNNFFLTDAGNKLAWWQAQGAGIYAGGAGVAVMSQLPSASTKLLAYGT